MYGSIGEELLSSSSLFLPFCSLDSTTPRYRVARLSNIAGRRFLRRHVYPALCRILGRRERERAGMTTTGTKYITCFPLKKQI